MGERLQKEHKMSIKQLVMDAMLAAICAVLGYLALDLGYMKITFETVPIILGALLFGPLDGVAIGGIGTLIYQLLKYGVSVTTVLWILPYVFDGLFLGLYAKLRKFNLGKKETMISIVLSEIMITALNTGVIYVDSKIFGYYTPAYVWGALFIRIVICIVKAVCYGALMPSVLDAGKKVLRQ